MVYVCKYESTPTVAVAALYPCPSHLMAGLLSIVSSNDKNYVAMAERICLNEGYYLMVAAAARSVREINFAIREKKAQFGLTRAVGNVKGLELEVILALENTRITFDELLDNAKSNRFLSALRILNQ